ncbi:hypothetical protein GJ496_001802 [Pomphorhynchus laevis]|nr:hypothetical protein GJ496_001802 [Pomphorhynchus laevis]
MSKRNCSLFNLCVCSIEENFVLSKSIRQQIAERYSQNSKTTSAKSRSRFIDSVSFRTVYLCNLLDSNSDKWIDLITILLRCRSTDFVGYEQSILSSGSTGQQAFANVYLSKFALLERTLIETTSRQCILLFPTKMLCSLRLEFQVAQQSNADCIEFENELRRDYLMLIINQTEQAGLLHKLHKEYRLLKENTKKLCIEGRGIDYKTSTKLADFFIGLLLRNFDSLTVSDLKSHIAHCLAIRFTLLKMYNRGWEAVSSKTVDRIPHPIKRYRLDLKYLRLDNLSPARPMKSNHIMDFKRLLNGRSRDIAVVNCQLCRSMLITIGYACRKDYLRKIFMQNVYVEGDVLCSLAHMLCCCGCFTLSSPFRNDRNGGLCVHIDTAYSRVLHKNCLFVCAEAGCITSSSSSPSSLPTFQSSLVELCLSNVLVSAMGLNHLANLLHNSRRLQSLTIRYLLVTPKFDNTNHNTGFNNILKELKYLPELECVHLESMPTTGQDKKTYSYGYFSIKCEILSTITRSSK